MGFYIDCLNGKIIDVRPVIDVTTVFSNGQGKDDLYGNMALNTALALCAYEGIEESQIDEVYKVIYNSMCNEKQLDGISTDFCRIKDCHSFQSRHSI